MLSCMGLLGIHPLEPQYKVTVGNVARTDFLKFFQGYANPFSFSYFPPVVAMPSMNCFWNMMYRMTIGMIAMTDPAINCG